MANLGEVVVQIRAEMAQFKRAFKDATRTVLSFTRTSRSALSRLTGAIKTFGLNVARHLGRSLVRNLRRAAIAMVALSVASIKTFADLESQMTMVGTLFDEQTTKTIPAFTAAMQEMSIEFGQSTKTVTGGLFDIVSASVDAQHSLGFIEQASKLAVAGFTDVKTATSAMITGLQAFDLEATEAERISDALFQTMKVGRITFTDLANNLGTMASIANQAGLSLESLGAVFSAVTLGGLSPERSATSIRAIFSSFLKPMEESIEVAAEFGVELNAAALAGDELFKTFTKLRGATAEQLAAMFPNIRAMQGVSVALAKVLKSTEFYESILDSAGQTAAAFAKVQDTIVFQLDRVKQGFLAVMRAAVVPFRDAIFDFLKRLADRLAASQDHVTVWATVFMRNFQSLITFLKNDLSATLGVAVKVMLEVFKGFGKSLMVLFEDIFVTLGANFFVWIRKGMRAREARNLVIKEMSERFGGAMGEDLRKAWEAGWIGTGARVLNAPTFDEAVARATAVKLDQLNKAMGDLDFATISLGDTTGELGDIVLETGDNIKSLWAEVADGAGLTVATYSDAMDDLRVEQEKQVGIMMEFQGQAKKTIVDPKTDIVPPNKAAAATIKSIWKDTSDSIAGAMSGAFADIATNAKSMTEALTNMLNQIHRALSQEVFMQLLFPSIKGLIGLGAVAKTEPTGPEQPFKPAGHARGGLVGRGLGRVLHAASGMLVPQGTDTVPIMATPGEEVVEKPIVDFIKRQQSQPPSMTINVNAVTGRDAYAFLESNKRTIASMMQQAMSSNHPLRREK